MIAQRKGNAAVDTVHGADGRLLRVEDIAERLNISRSMAWKLVSTGEIRSVRIGRAVRVRPADVTLYLADPARER